MNAVSSERVREIAHSISIRDAELGREVDAAVDRCFSGVRVQVSGRTGVGKSSVRAVLKLHRDLRIDDVEIVETASIDVPRAPDPILDGDVLVHVLTSGAQQADIDVLASSPEVVAVLAKADTVDDLDSVAAALSAAVGMTVHPVMGTIAANVMRGRPDTFDPLRAAAPEMTPDVCAEALLTPDRFLRATLPVSRRVRVELVESIETRGIGFVVDALRANPATDDATLRLLLSDKSGIDDAARAVRRAVDAVHVDRQGQLLHRLTELAAQYPLVTEFERYLASDEAVVAIMRSALRVLREPEDPQPSLPAVQMWRDRWQSARDPGHARASLAVARGYLRLSTP
ncbi:hypothetical protein QMK17_15515 [Rhodococcus sp. G-MC3]|uniref:hypothetical protein n=1 Tax=Rhodococcus sp. G-MC3 TaxID=3046209 RepID=UPI0024BA05CC|nr:hypothetical protein [Rhodococcus sp. G-MC3]MDJ0394733.1 hypothetical protein [Rhodococcus sp. G-MC3]